MHTVREATIDVLRRYDLTTIFANPGSTEIPFLTGLPGDLRFILALHEGSVVGSATGYALARELPALVLLHTTAGLGNAVGALATARVNRAPLVVLVGQQDRRHLALEPFLAGHLTGMAGSYPVHVEHPVRAQDVPGAVARAWYEARERPGPAVVIVPMDDWDALADEDIPVPAPRSLLHASGRADPERVDELRVMLERAAKPALVVGAGTDSAGAWAALTALSERLGCPVWQEPFGARAGFPQDHPLFAGHLPPVRSGLRDALAGHDLVVVAGAAAFRQYQYEPGPLLPDGARLAVVTADPAEAMRSPADLAVLGDPGDVCSLLARMLPARELTAAMAHPAARMPPPPGSNERLRAAHVLTALAARLPRDTVLVEETPSSRPDLHSIVPARTPMGFLSAAMGGLGFGLPAAIGVRMASNRPVVAVLGDGSSLYQIQALWTAAHYGCGILVLVLANGRYAVMDQLARNRGTETGETGETGEMSETGETAEAGPWPPFDEVRVAGMARALGCDAREVGGLPELERALDDVLPSLSTRETPLLLDVAVAAS